VLHIDDHDEIDYTANGHRVPEHMENAMNEIEKIEHRVRLSMPRYLKESAAQVPFPLNTLDCCRSVLVFVQ
jgi:hypothetical protein